MNRNTKPSISLLVVNMASEICSPVHAVSDVAQNGCHTRGRNQTGTKKIVKAWKEVKVPMKKRSSFKRPFKMKKDGAFLVSKILTIMSYAN